MRSFTHKFLALLLACNYFAFRVELCEEEYEANHRPVSTECSLASPSINWETFDKDNAPKAIVVTVETVIELLHYLYNSRPIQFPPYVQFDLVRDKSPPTPA